MLPARSTLVTLAALVALHSPIQSRAADSPAGATDSVTTAPVLAASTAEPWNPPEPVPAAEIWEQSVRLPFKVISIPFSLLGRGTKNLLLTLDAHHATARVESLVVEQRRIGLFVLPASLGDRTGFGAAVRYQPPALRYLLLEADGSLQGYSRVLVSVAPGPASLTYHSEWRPQDQFFGLGPSTTREQVSNYAARTQDVQLVLTGSLSARTLRPIGRMASSPSGPSWTGQLWGGPRAVLMSDGRDERGVPLSVAHPDVAANQVVGRLEHMVYGARLRLDARSGTPHWGKGGGFALEAVRYGDPVPALALRDAHTPAQAFTRYTAEMDVATSWWRDPRTLRLFVRAVALHMDEGVGTVPIQDLARLGASAGLSGYEPSRFHDTNSLVAKLTYIFPLARFFEFDLHGESGGVFPDLSDAPRFDQLSSSVGAALRLRTKYAVVGEFGVDVSREGSRIAFTLGSVE